MYTYSDIFLCFFYIIDLQKIKKEKLLLFTNPKTKKVNILHTRVVFFLSFFSYRLNSADACSLINMFVFIYLFIFLKFIYMWPWVVQVETDSQICCVPNGWKVWQKICLKWPQKWRKDDLHVYTDSCISICPVQVFELSSVRQEWHFASC